MRQLERSKDNKNGFGGGLSAQQLIRSNLKCSASAELRTIYDTYSLALSYMPFLSNTSNTEFSLTAQRVVSHNQTANNNIIGLKVAFFADRVNYTAPIYGLNSVPIVDGIGSWISQPAVKMNQVLAISEEYVHLAATSISSISPSFGPLEGGNTVVISGVNFLPGAMVQFGNVIATITAATPTSLTVIVPAGTQLGAVNVKITMPNGKSILLNNAYLYSNGFVPIITGELPLLGPIAGGTFLTINGVNFVSGATSVNIGGIEIPATSVTVNSPTSLTVVTPPHLVEGTVMITVTTPAGTSNPYSDGFTYLDVPTVSALNPSSGATAGGAFVTISGSNFAAGNTEVIVDGITIPAQSVTVNSATSLTFLLPAHVAGNVPVTITTPGGLSNAIPGGFTYSNAAATISSLSSASGPSSGGTTITITGTNFEVGNTSVTIGSVVIPATSVTVNSPTSLTFNTPVQAAGTVAVTITTSVGTSGFVPGGFTYLDLPTVDSLAPIAGAAIGGTMVTISGSNFVTGDTSVTIGGTAIPVGSVLVNSSSSLTFTAPAHIAGNVAVTVTTAGGVSTAVPGGFTYADVPTIDILSPSFGPDTGGSLMTITGTNFVAGNTSVTIGGTLIPVGSVNVSAATSLSFLTPAHTAGNVAVLVTSVGGTSNPASGGFTYADTVTATSLSPALGSSTGGTLLTVNGTNFVAGDTSITIGGTVVPAGSVTVNSATSLTFMAPVHAAGTVAVTVTTSGGISNAIPGGFTYIDPPSATGLVPAFASSTGGTLITISGANFVTGDTSVMIGGTSIPPGSVTVNSPLSLTFIAPAHLAGNVAVIVSTSGGSSNAIASGLTYEDPPTAILLTPAFGSSAGGTLVTIIGSNFITGDTAVMMDGTPLSSGSITVNSATSLSFVSPAHAAGTVAITVATAGGTSTAIPGGFTYTDQPSAAVLNPAFGSSVGGTLVEINGSNFVAGDTSVTIGGIMIPVGLVTVNSATSLTFTSPVHVAGTVVVTVSTSGGSSSDIQGGFTYEDIPTALSLTPASGPTAGGSPVTLIGTNFVAGDTEVTVGTTFIPASSVTVTSPTSLTFNTPAHALGNVAVTVANSAGTGIVPGGFTYDDTYPVVTSISPEFGPIAGGTLLTITGSNFVAGNTSVTIGASTIPAIGIMVINSTSLTLITPVQLAGNAAVSVTTPVGTSGFVPGGFTYEDLPTTISLIPNSGATTGGTIVTVIGTNFVAGDTSVTIGGVTIPSSAVTVSAGGVLTFTAPAHVAGNVALTVTTSGGLSNAVLGGFTYNDSAPTLTSLAPLSGPAAGGTLLTLVGTNFEVGNTTVSIGSTLIPAGSITVISPTVLNVTTPIHVAGNVAVSVTTSVGSSDVVPGGFSYLEIPATTTVSPLTGPAIGGSILTITGSDFVNGDTSVTIGGVLISAGSVLVNSSSSLTVVAPAHVAGNVAITVSTAGGTSNSVPGGFTYADAPTATLIAPAFGFSAGGSLVTVSGTDFVVGDTEVNIGGTVIPSGAVTVSSPTSLTFTTPAHVAGNVAVTVTTPGGVSSVLPGGFTYEDLPSATAIVSAFGPSAGGTSVTISGSNFVAGDTSVNIGGTIVPVGAVTVNSSNSLTFTLPAHAAGNVAVMVSTSSGPSGLIAGGFTYEDSPIATLVTPAFGSSTGGTLVVVSGINFVAGDTSVNIGGTIVPSSAVTVNSAIELSFNTPAHAAGNVALTVSTSGGISTTVPGGFTYEDVPSATSLAPTSGPETGGTSVTISGTNFVVGDTSVTIGGTIIPAGVVTVNSAESLTFTTPVHIAGTTAVSVSTSGGSSADIPGGFTYIGAPTAVTINPTSGTTAGDTAVSITGTNFIAGNTSVTIGGNVVPAGSVTVNAATSLTFNAPAHTAGNVAVNVTTAGGTSAHGCPI